MCQGTWLIESVAAANAAAPTGCFDFGRWQYHHMKDGDVEGNPINKRIVHIPLSSSSAVAADGEYHIQGELTIPLASSKPKALIIFAHGSGSGKDSPRNRQVAQVLNENGFATLL